MAQTSSSGSSGAGQQTPTDGNSDFTVITFIVRQMLAQLDTMKLVKVVKVTGGGGAIAAAGTVDVQLLVNQIDGDGNATENGVVHGVPWYRLQGGKNAVICDPQVGDVGFVVVSDRDISNLKAPGAKKQVNPGSFRKYSVADGVYIGGALNETPDQHIVFTDDTIKITDKTGNVIEMKSSGIELTPSGALPVTVNGNLIVTGNFQLGGSVLSQAGAVYAGNIETTGDVIAGGKSVKTHTHSQGADSHGDNEVDTSAPL
jgi:hypothetical protein